MKQQETPKCERKEELIEYLYDEMPAAQRARFADHLQTCANCSADLTGLERLRGELRAWDLHSVPRMEIVIPRSKLEVLKELLMLFPAWSRAALATAAAAAVVLMAIGVVSMFNRANGAPTTLAQTAASPTPNTPSVASVSVNAEVKALVNAEVAKALEQERQVLRAQLAALETRDSAQRAQLQTVSRQLRELNTRHQQLLAAQQPSIRSIFSEFDSSGER
jgi:anti-sigma factor RsiW